MSSEPRTCLGCGLKTYTNPCRACNMSITAAIPAGVQLTVRELAERMKCFVERAENGGSWMELQTWLLAMRPGFDLLDGIDMPRTARMSISPQRQDEIAADFTVPDTIDPRYEDPTDWRNQT